METKPEEKVSEVNESVVKEPEVKVSELKVAQLNQQKITKAEEINRNMQARKVVYYILGVLETLFAFRLVFKLLGANPGSSFVKSIYSLTDIFLTPFEDIFRTKLINGIETQAILEPALLIAIISYAIFAWGIIRLIGLFNKQKN